MLGIATKAGKIMFGTESCLEGIFQKKLKLVIVAEDAADRTKKHFQEKCEQAKINFYIFGTSEEISKAIGKENKTVVGIKDKNIAGAIEKILNGGDVIG